MAYYLVQGLTDSDAVRLLLTRVAQEKALPFVPLVPNEETVTAMTPGSRSSSHSLRLEHPIAAPVVR